jgi:hypothetical protein
VLAHLLHHRLDERREREGVLHARLRVHHADLDRAELRVRADVVPEVRVVADHLRLLHKLDAADPVLEVVVAGWDPHAREGAEHRRARGIESRGVPPPERRVRRQREEHRHVHAHPVRHVDGLVGIVHAHVHVDAEDDLLARHELEPRDQVAIARARHDPLVLPQRKGVRPGGADREPVLMSHLIHRAPERAELRARLGRRPHGGRGDLAHALHQLGLDLPLRGDVAEVGKESLDRVREVQGLLVHDHELFLDAQRVRGAREPVLHIARRV